MTHIRRCDASLPHALCPLPLLALLSTRRGICLQLCSVFGDWLQRQQLRTDDCCCCCATFPAAPCSPFNTYSHPPAVPCRAVPYLATPPAARHTLYTFSICHLKLAFFFAPAFWLAQHLSSINLNTLQPPGAARFCHSVATVACAANTICCQFSSGIKDLTHGFGLIHSSFELFRTISRLNEFFTTTTSTTKPQH